MGVYFNMSRADNISKIFGTRFIFTWNTLVMYCFLKVSDCFWHGFEKEVAEKRMIVLTIGIDLLKCIEIETYDAGGKPLLLLWDSLNSVRWTNLDGKNQWRLVYKLNTLCLMCSYNYSCRPRSHLRIELDTFTNFESSLITSPANYVRQELSCFAYYTFDVNVIWIVCSWAEWKLN